VKKLFFYQRVLILIAAGLVLTACATGSQITRTQNVSASADVPYENILIISLFNTYQSRKRLETDIVRSLAELGVNAVPSTSMMTTKTPLTRQGYVEMVDKIDADAVLITQLVDVASKTAMANSASPEATYNVRPTYYFNVWDVQLTEYMEPPKLEVNSEILMATQMFSVSSEKAEWAIESRLKVTTTGGPRDNYLVYLDEAQAIVNHLARDGVVAK
jgi:hypothetical protein